VKLKMVEYPKIVIDNGSGTMKAGFSGDEKVSC
jgi:actin-related protein